MAFKTISFALLALIPFLAAPVASQQSAINQDGCVTSFDPNIDYFPAKITVDNAALFKAEYFKNYKVITNTYAKKQYVLTQCGTTAPSPAQFPNNTVFVTVPVTNAAAMITTSVAFIEMLGKRSVLKAVDTEGLVSSPCVQYDLENNKTIGIEDRNKTLRAEQFKNIDVVFMGFGSEPGAENKTILTSEAQDPGPLNRAEWLEFYSTFFNLEEQAQVLTSQINNQYACFRKAANANAIQPVIAWTSYVAPATYNNNTPSWTLSGAEYKRIISTDAGAKFFNGTTSSSFTNNADFLNEIKSVDIIIDESMTAGPEMDMFLKNYGLTADADFKFLKSKAVYRQDGIVNPNDGRDWFMNGVVMNDAVLQDIVRATHPEALPSDVPYNWIRNIAKREPRQILASANCLATDSNKPVLDRAINCATMKAGGNTTGNAATKTVAGVLTAVLGLLTLAWTL